MNRSDLMGIVAGCKTAEQRIKELCERFGRDTYLAACQALLDRTRRAMQTLIERNISTEPQSFEDYVDDDGLGNGPFKMKLTIWREGDRAVFDWTGTDPQAAGPINFYLNEGMFKMFIGVYLIMVYDPQILFNDGFYDLIESRLPDGCLLHPTFPAPLGCRTHALARLFDVMGGCLGQKSPELTTAAGYGTSPPPAVQRHRQKRGVLLHHGDQLRRYSGPTDGRRHRRPLVVAAVHQYPDRVSGELLPAAGGSLRLGDGFRRRRPASRRQRHRQMVYLSGTR